MKLRCWPGCLAIVIKTRQTPEAVGMTVEVIRPGSNGEVFHRADSTGRIVTDGISAGSWVVRSAHGPMPWRLDEGILAMAHFAVIADSSLLPITPPPGSETETVAEVLEAARSNAETA